MSIIAIVTNAKKKFEKYLDDLNRMLPMLKTVGLSLKDIDVDVGILPSASVTVVGSIRNLDPAKIRQLREANKDNRLLSAVLKAVETAVNVKGFLTALKADTIEVHATLGLWFNVNCRFIPSPELVGIVVPTGDRGPTPTLPSGSVATA